MSEIDTDPPVSTRVWLALLAGQVIALTDGITATTGPAERWQTVGSKQTIAGVLAVEDVNGRVEIEIHLVARWPPQSSLEQLAQQLRARLRHSAGSAGMGERLGAVSIAFDDLIADTAST